MIGGFCCVPCHLQGGLQCVQARAADAQTCWTLIVGDPGKQVSALFGPCAQLWSVSPNSTLLPSGIKKRQGKLGSCQVADTPPAAGAADSSTSRREVWLHSKSGQRHSPAERKGQLMPCPEDQRECVFCAVPATFLGTVCVWQLSVSFLHTGAQQVPGASVAKEHLFLHSWCAADLARCLWWT